jgi:GTPase Era involved in 16S rRNA processing
MTVPVFAIVGHPNKGKSSIVSTLARDDSVAISPLPGSTVDDREYPMVIDGETLYMLVDTPGFQRARAAMEWMRQQAGTALDRPDIVRRFVERHRDDPRFEAECNLLQPILEGAGILYVVDGSRPFGQEYEAEMEILRWTGQPSLALVNMVGEGDFTGQWQNALGQYFRIVRVFDAMTADFDKRTRLLLAFGQIREAWRAPLERAVQVLEAEQLQRRRTSARLIAEMIGAMITHTRQRRLAGDEVDEPGAAKLRAAYADDLQSMERKCRAEVEQIYNYPDLERHEAVVELLDSELFARRTWSLFGLSRQQLIATGGVGGAAAGSVIDLAVGGSSLFMGAGLGALIGGVSAWFAADRVAATRVFGTPLGGKGISIGPMLNINFPYVVLGRALLHHRMVEDRTHACRGPLELVHQAGALQGLASDDRMRIERLFTSMRRQESLTADLLDKLAAEIVGLMQRPTVTATGDAAQRAEPD